MKLKVEINTKTLSATLIDDAESTPGASRVITAFRLHVIPAIIKRLEDSGACTFDIIKIKNVYNHKYLGDGLQFFASGYKCLGSDNHNSDKFLMTFELFDPFKRFNNIPHESEITCATLGRYIITLLLGIACGVIASNLL